MFRFFKEVPNYFRVAILSYIPASSEQSGSPQHDQHLILRVFFTLAIHKVYIVISWWF